MIIPTIADGVPPTLQPSESQEVDLVIDLDAPALAELPDEFHDDVDLQLHQPSCGGPVEASMPRLSADLDGGPGLAAVSALVAGSVAVVAIYVGFPLVLAARPHLGTLADALGVALAVLALGFRAGLALLRSTARPRARVALHAKPERALATRRAPGPPSLRTPLQLAPHNPRPAGPSILRSEQVQQGREGAPAVTPEGCRRRVAGSASGTGPRGRTDKWSL